MDLNNTISAIFYDPKQGYLSASKLYKKVKDVNPNVRYKDVTDFLRTQDAWLLAKKSKKPKVFRTVFARYRREYYEMDVLVYDRYEVDKYKYILVCVDTYSRYCQAVALTNMNAPTLLQAIKKIFKVMDPPTYLKADQQFTASVIVDYLGYLNVTAIISETDEVHKNPIVERLNGTLRNMLQRWRLAQKGPKRWYRVLPDIVESYNNNYHRTIRAKPEDVWFYREPNSQRPIVTQQPAFNIGDLVRAKYEKRVFDKIDEVRYTKEVYRVIDKPRPNRYTLQNVSSGTVLKKAHKDEELIRQDQVQPQVQIQPQVQPQVQPQAPDQIQPQAPDQIQTQPRYKEYAPTTYQGTRSMSRVLRSRARV